MRLACWAVAALSILPALGWAASGTVVVEGRVVPLPPGEWREVGRGVEVDNLRYTGQQYRLGKAIFVQEKDGRATAMTVVWAASTNPGTTINWRVEPVCRREDLFAQLSQSTDHRSMDCLAVGAFMPARRRGERVAAEWRGYMDELESRPDWIPPTWVFASYRLTDPYNLLAVEYRFSPEAHGFAPDRRAWAANGWNPGNLDGPRRGFMERVRYWATWARPALWQAFQRNAGAALPRL